MQQVLHPRLLFDYTLDWRFCVPPLELPYILKIMLRTSVSMTVIVSVIRAMFAFPRYLPGLLAPRGRFA